MKDRSGFIRPLVICVFSRNGKILACCGRDEVKKNEFYRPLGGMIEFGETSEEALRREIREELSQEIKNVRFLAMFENIFTYNGKPHHEIVIVYDADFIDEKIYDMEVVEVFESGWYKAHWLSVDDCRAGKHIVYPEGLFDVL